MSDVNTEIKVGDRFVLNTDYMGVRDGYFKTGDVVEITKVLPCGSGEFKCIKTNRKSGDYIIKPRFSISHGKVTRIETPPKTTPRPHAELIKQWADDEDCVVEFYSEGLNKWVFASTPPWLPEIEYRIKPKTPSIKTELLEQIAKMEQDLAEMKAKANQVGEE